MMKNYARKILLAFFAFNFIACSTVSMPGSTEIPQATVIPTLTPTMTPVPTGTDFPTATPTAVSTDKRVITRCLNISQTNPANVNLSGEVFLTGEVIVGKGYSGVDSILDLQSEALAPIKTPEKVRQGGYLVSPNREKYAYWKFNIGTNDKAVDVSLVIKNRVGKVLAEVPGDLKYWDTFYWLDNERLVIGMYGQPSVENPFTGKSFDLSKWYAQSPGGLKTIPVWGVNGIFDSQLSRLFYIQEDNTMLMWDLESRKILASLLPKSSHRPSEQPKWSWEFSQIVLAYSPIDAPKASDEFYSVSREGQIRQLTNLGRYFLDVGISKFSWSPDGTRIAFFFSDFSQPDISSHFAILDLETLDVTDYCHLSGSMYTHPDVEPVWSPDGTKILIGRLESDKITVKTILVDISDEYAAQLAEDLVPTGWMKAP